MPPVKGTLGRGRPAFGKPRLTDLMPGIKKLLDSGPEPTKTEGAPFDSVECEVKTGEDWLLTYWWWKHESWWVAEKLWRAIVEPVVIEYLQNNDPDKADDPLYLDGLMAEFDFKALDTKLIELLQFADEEQERNAGLTKVEGE